MICIVTTSCIATAQLLKPKKLITDQTFGRYEENLEAELILVTMTPKDHARLTGLKPVPLNADLPPQYADFIDQLNTKYGLKRVANWPLPAIDIFCVVFEVPETGNRDDVVTALAQEPGIETAQIVQTFDTQAFQYNDPYLNLQHAVHSIQAIPSHEWSRGEGVRVAIIDTGMDNTHPEISSNTESTKNFVDSNDALFRTDSHGTAVGGVIAANTNNLTGMVGIAPDATLLALKACWHAEPNSRKATCNSLTLAKAINYSILQKVDIINLSLTGPPDPVLERLILEALARNIVVVGAKPAHDKEAFPVSIPGTIAVTLPNDRSTAIAAPGRRVLSLKPDEQYDFFDGSSFSTAHISGLAALLRSLAPSLSPANVLALLEQSTNPETGVVNACKAVQVIKRQNGEQMNRKNCG